MTVDENEDRETFSSPACSMHEFEDELLPKPARKEQRVRFAPLLLAGIGAIAAVFGSIQLGRRLLSRTRRARSSDSIDVDVS